MSFEFLDISMFIYPFFLFWAIILSLFLFWRACRHELFKSEEAFDLTFVSALGAFVFSRVFDFIFRTDLSTWSLSTFIFFNRYGSFDFWGALFGIVVANFVFLRGKKTSFFFVLDLFAAPLAFGQALVVLGRYLSEFPLSLKSVSLYYFAGYLLLFLVLKRLSSRKRHEGFFISLYLIVICALDLAFFRFRTNIHYLFGVPYELAAPGVIAIAGILIWYILSKRKAIGDIKKVFGGLLLGVFRLRRMVTSADEAGKFSKSVIFFPYFVLRTIFMLMLMLGREIRLALLEFLYVLGLRKFFK